MVVPMEPRASRSRGQPQQFVGNNLTVNIESNRNYLIIIGNNCKLRLEENRGTVKIVGNHCELVVSKGTSDIKYVGNNGRIRLGSGMSSDSVRYVGNQGKISVVNDTFDANGAGNGHFKSDVVISNSNRIHVANSGFKISRDFFPKTCQVK